MDEDVLHFNLLKNQAEFYIPPESVNREYCVDVSECVWGSQFICDILMKIETLE